MKVLYLSNIPSPYRVAFFNELSKYCQLTVVFERHTAKDRNGEWYDTQFDFEVIFLNSISIGKESSLSLDIIHYLKSQYDHIIIGGYSTLTAMCAILYLRLHKINFILNADGGFIAKDESNIKKRIKHFFISSASKYLCSGEKTKAYLEYYGANSDDVYTFPFTSVSKKDILPYPISREQKEKLKEMRNIPYTKVIISIGRFIHGKGFDWMMEAYKDLDKEIGVYIIGGTPTQEYMDLKNKYKLDNVHFVPFQSKPEILAWYQLADLFVFPTRKDIWGLVVNEALSQGLPVISTDQCNAALSLIHI